MFDDVVAFQSFYRTRQGSSIRSILAPRTDGFWQRGPDACNAALGFGTPFLRPTSGGFALMPQRHGAVAWPSSVATRSLLIDPHCLPFQDVQLDRLLIVHALEFDTNPADLLAEAWRALDGSGRLMVIVPHRLGLWARAEQTPFGHGRPFSRRQLRDIMVTAGFEVTRMSTALFTPPSARGWSLQIAPTIERIGQRWMKPLGGVLIAEANKLLYAPAGNTSKLRTKEGLKSPRLVPQSGRAFHSMETR